MDPDQTLRDIRATLAGLNEADLHNDTVIGEIAEKFSALDDWLVLGGFLPKDWSR